MIYNGQEVDKIEGTLNKREFVRSPLDTLSQEERSERMRLVKGRDTKPEWRVREILKKLGYRYRLQYSKLPGKPDFAFPGKRKAIWVHGCFWHRHENCALARLPKGVGIFGFQNWKEIRNAIWSTKIRCEK